jgi:hypothetical protein
MTMPVELILSCPACLERHIDEGEWATRDHHTHACQHCGMVWRPAIVHTVGVRFLSGFKNMEKPDAESSASSETPEPALTIAAVQEALSQAAPGADELNQQLKEVFSLTGASATLRLR